MKDVVDGDDLSATILSEARLRWLKLLKFQPLAEEDDDHLGIKFYGSNICDDWMIGMIHIVTVTR